MRGYLLQPFKYIARRLLPKNVIFLIITLKDHWYDIKRYARYSNTHYQFDSSNKVKGKLTMLYHVIEKGLTMPETRLGFGNKVVGELIDLCELYISKGYDSKDVVLVHSIKVLNEYVAFHQSRDHALPPSVINRIKELAKRAGVLDASKQHFFTDTSYFQHHDASFDQFCISRHSARNFIKKEVDVRIINDCIRMALKAPSACNRQPSRVYVVKKTDLKAELLNLQSGNRGFGHLADSILVITADLSVFQNNDERREALFNSGLFTMTLIYALHFHKIGACLLNWSTSVDNDQRLRALLNIPENEVVAITIAIGYVPKQFKIAISPRKKVSEITQYF